MGSRFTETMVLIIGGGATGMGTLRDLSLRGIPALLVEQGGLAHGTSSRFHGLLHSGARYAVNDTESAKECIEENLILRRIGKNCVEESEGYFVQLPEDDPDYIPTWVRKCTEAGIDVQEISPEEACRSEPALTRDIKSVYRVPDSSIDGFRLVLHNMMSAKRRGGRVLLYHKVTSITQKNSWTKVVSVENTRTHETFDIYCKIIVNAAGSWTGHVAELAGLRVPVQPDKGTLIVFNHRIVSRVINRLHKGSDGDIFVPHGSITILGTTSIKTDRPDDTSPSKEEIEYLMEIGSLTLPRLSSCRILRAFAGTRPLYTDTKGGKEGRNASRNFLIIDHGEEGLEGFFSIFGGKLTTYRLMAERVSDKVAQLLGVETPCSTHLHPMIEERPSDYVKRAERFFPVPDISFVVDRAGDALEGILQTAEHRTRQGQNPLLCECEMVSLAEIEYVAKDPDTHSLSDIRLRTRLGMGTCQGTFCALRTQNALYDHDIMQESDLLTSIQNFLEERFRGIRQTLWGVQAQEMQLSQAIYCGVLNLNGNRYAHIK